MRILLTYLLATITLTLIGCDVEHQESEYTCNYADTENIDGTIGFTDVYRVNFGYGIDIGYYHQGVLVPHAECAPARVTFNGTSTLFEYFEYGQPKETDGITAITFSSLNTGLQAFFAERDDRQGRASFDWGEREYDRDDRGRLTKQLWLSEFPFESITAESNHESSGIIQATAVLGASSKTTRYNDNSISYDCVYSSSTGNEVSLNCENENALDQQFFGVEIDLLPYIDALNKRPGYETEPRELCEDVNRYQPDDGTCEQ